MKKDNNKKGNVLSALKRMIIMLIKKDDLNIKNTNRVYLLGSARGITCKTVDDLILDCQVEYSVN